MELTFVYPTEGCGKTQSEINDTIPHTVVDMGYQGAECTYPHESTRSECCSVSSFLQENFHIFNQGLAKKHFHKYVKSNGSAAWLYKSKHFSFTDNTHRGIAKMKKDLLSHFHFKTF